MENGRYKVGRRESKYTSIYSNIQNFMRKEGWEHIEGSVYMSTEPLSNTKVLMLIDSLNMMELPVNSHRKRMVSRTNEQPRNLC